MTVPACRSCLSCATSSVTQSSLPSSGDNLFLFVGKNVVPGEKAKGLVLHVDAITSKAYVSLREELLKKRAKQVGVQF